MIQVSFGLLTLISSPDRWRRTGLGSWKRLSNDVSLRSLMLHARLLEEQLGIALLLTRGCIADNRWLLDSCPTHRAICRSALVPLLRYLPNVGWFVREAWSRVRASFSTHEIILGISDTAAAAVHIQAMLRHVIVFFGTALAMQMRALADNSVLLSDYSGLLGVGHL